MGGCTLSLQRDVEKCADEILNHMADSVSQAVRFLKETGIDGGEARRKGTRSVLCEEAKEFIKMQFSSF